MAGRSAEPSVARSFQRWWSLTNRLRMYIIIAIVVFAAIAVLVVAEFVKRRRRKRRYPVQPDGIRTCTTCGRVLKPDATDCDHCGPDSVVIVV